MRPIQIDKEARPEAVDPGSAPMLQWVKIELLVVDDAYQRELKPGNWKAIRAIAAEFRWSRFSPVFIAPIEGGKYAIIDGQHRVHAAAICGFSEVPCQIVQMSIEEQAAAFAAVNGAVTKVTVWHIYKAALVAGEKWAVEADQLATEAGCKLMTNNAAAAEKKPGQIYGIRTFVSVMEEYDRSDVLASLTLMSSAEGYRDTPELWDAGIWAPVCKALCQRPRAVAHPQFRPKFETLDIWQFMDVIDAERRRRIRTGMPQISKKEQLETMVIDWVDRRFPERILIPKGEVA
jgi:hypothetical protein